MYTYNEPELLGRTVRRLAPSPVIVHVDKKVPLEPFIWAVDERDRDRVSFLTERRLVNWAGYSQVETIRALVKEALSVTAPDDYVVMLSGQDYPLYSGEHLAEFFAQAGGQQFMRYFRINDSDNAYRAQFYERHYRDLPLLDRRVLKPRMRKVRTASVLAVDAVARLLPSPRVPDGLVPCFGPTHFALTADYLAYLESLVTDEIEAFFRTTFCPEELFYMTLAASGPRRINNGATRPDGSEPFVGRGNWRYANLHVIDPSLTRIFTAQDWSEVASTDKLFLRKLSMKDSRSLLDRIDASNP